MAEALAKLDAEVRRVDEDRWLASRFAAPEARRRLVALYALNHELARTSDIVREPGVGAIRLAWWRDAINAVIGGAAAPPHAALDAYAAAGGEAADAPVWQAMIEARTADFESSPFASIDAIEGYVDATAGGLMRLALRASGVTGEGAEMLASSGGKAWGLAGLLRAEPFWRARGRRLTPGEGCSHADLIGRARAAHVVARGLVRALPPAAFAAVGYVALAPVYLDALEAGRAAPPLFARQVRLVVAAATGRL